MSGDSRIPAAPEGDLSGRSAIVVGCGVGGLSAACYLARAGADVRIVEKNEQAGGRASRLYAEDFRFDMGPSWYLMPEVFERFFEHFGKRSGDYYAHRRLDPHYRIFFKDGDVVDIPADLEGARQVFERYEPGAAARLDAYLEQSRANYEIGMAEFVYRDRRLRELFSWDVLRHARDMSFLGSMEQHVAKYFEHPKLQQIMQYTLVFLGGSPRNTPALYNLMSHVDFNMGVFYPEGGIGALVDALVSLAEELGVEIVLDSEVAAIEPAGDGLIVRAGGQELQGDIVVSNADYAHTELQLLPESARRYGARYWSKRTYAPSAYLLYLGVRGDVERLAHHTLVLPTDWDPHFERIFDRPGWPEDPAYYLCVPSKTDPTVAPPEHSNLFLLVPIAPGLDDAPDIRSAYRERMLDDVAAHTGTDLRDRIVFEQSFCVSDFAGRYNSTRGSALGLAHTISQSAFFRPGIRSKKLPGLYYTGAGTRPGIGVPMCLIGGELTARDVIEDLGAGRPR